jgi:hypothetical protein
MMQDGKSMIVWAGAVFVIGTVALLPSLVLGEGVARRDVVRQAAEVASAEHAAPNRSRKMIGLKSLAPTSWFSYLM